MPGAGSIYRLATGEFVGTIHDGDAAGLAAAKAALAGGGLLQMGPGTEGIALGAGWGGIPPAVGIGLVRIDATGGIYISRFHMTDGQDPTKRMFWDLSAVTTGIERTIQVLDWSGILPLPINEGAPGTFLRSGGGVGQPTWAAVSVSNALLDGANHTDTVAQAVTRGSLIYGNATPRWDELVIGAANTFLGSDGTDVSWRSAGVIAALLQHDLLLHLKPFSVANVNWTRTQDTLSTSGGGFANVKVGDYILLGANVTASTQGAKVTVVTDTNNITVNLTKAGGDPSDLTNVTIFVAPGDHFNDTGAVDTNGDGVGLFLTGGRGTYNTGNTSGSFQELRGPIRWRGQGQSASTFLPSDFRVATSGSAGTRSGFCFDGAASGAAGKVYWLVNASLGSDTTILIPDLDPSAGSDTMVFTGLVQTLLSKTLQGTNTKIVTDGTTNHTVFQNGGFGDRLGLDLSLMTALRAQKPPDYAGTFHVTGTPTTLSGATPAVTGARTFKITNGGATNMTGTTGQEDGQEITLIFTNGNTTLKDTSTTGTFELPGSADITPVANEVFRFVWVNADSKWYTVSRSQN